MPGSYHEPGSAASILKPDGHSVGLVRGRSGVSWAHFKHNPHGLVYFGPCEDDHAEIIDAAMLARAASLRSVETNVGRVMLAEPTPSFFSRSK